MYKIINEYLPLDIVSYCLVPYLMISKSEVVNNHKCFMKELNEMSKCCNNHIFFLKNKVVRMSLNQTIKFEKNKCWEEVRNIFDCDADELIKCNFKFNYPNSI